MTSSGKSHATLRYTTMRLGIFVGCLIVVGLLAQFGLVPAGIGKSNPVWIVLLALVISAPLSFVLLRKQRDAMSEQIVDGVATAKERLHANQTQEDEAVAQSSAAQAGAQAAAQRAAGQRTAGQRAAGTSGASASSA